ncbi:MAG: carboxymuconolactone decarboxylase family protein [Micromonosporaceae bacterium]
MVAAWREATVFTEAERAALELAEQGTRIADAAGGVTAEAWANAAKHYDDDQLLALVVVIALINAYNRMSVIMRQPAGDYQPGQFGVTIGPHRVGWLAARVTGPEGSSAAPFPVCCTLVAMTSPRSAATADRPARPGKAAQPHQDTSPHHDGRACPDPGPLSGRSAAVRVHARRRRAASQPGQGGGRQTPPRPGDR